MGGEGREREVREREGRNGRGVKFY